VFQAEVALDDKEDAVVVWSRFDGAGYTIQAASRTGNRWSAPSDISGLFVDASSPQVALDAKGNAVAVWDANDGSGAVIQSASKPAGGAWSSPVTVSTAVGVAPQIGLVKRGNAYAVWEGFDSDSATLVAATKPAGGAWSAPTEVSAQGGSFPEIVVTPQGDAVAVWQRYDGTNQRIQAATRPYGGAWSVPTHISLAGVSASVPDVGVDAKGGAVAVWEQSVGQIYSVQASTRPAGGAWSTPVAISAPGLDGADFAAVAVDAKGDAVAVWGALDDSGDVIQGATKPAAGVWSTPIDVSGPSADLFSSEVAINVGGDAVAVWSRFSGSNYIVEARAFTF
jgi:hypothetical protein